MFARTAIATAFTTFVAASASATPMLDFIIDGDTFNSPFSFTNTSDGGESLTRFFIDIGPPGVVFDSDSNDGIPNNSGGAGFTSESGSDVTTGLTSTTFVDGGSTLDLMFNDFQSTETFTFTLDVDFDGTNFTVIGDELIGATAFADFSDGQRLTGVFAAIAGNPDASGFTATGITQTPAVPLPAAGWMLIAGLGGLAAMRRKKA